MILHSKTGNLKIAMIKNGLNVTQLAQGVGNDIAYISQVINGKRSPSPALAKRISETLNVEIDQIFKIVTKEE